MYLVVKFLYGFHRLTIRLVVGLLYKPVKTNLRVKKILVVRKGNLGDHICALPAYKAIQVRFPEASIHLLTSSGAFPDRSAEAIIRPDFFSGIWLFENYAPGVLKKMITEQSFDLVIELPQYLDTVFTQLRNMLFFRLCRITYGVGWSVDHLFTGKQTQLRKRKFEREPVRLLRILTSYGVQAGREDYSLLHVVAVANLPLVFSKTVVMAPGAKLARKRWDERNFAEVTTHLVNKGFNVVLIGSSEENRLAEVIAAKGALNLCGKLSPAQSGWLIAQSLLVITNDSAAMHMAYAQQKRVVALFSSRDYPGKWFPPAHTDYRVLYTPEVSCAVCIRDECYNNICMQQISVSRVIQEVDRALQLN